MVTVGEIFLQDENAKYCHNNINTRGGLVHTAILSHFWGIFFTGSSFSKFLCHL
jgi:hypothetical protein